MFAPMPPERHRPRIRNEREYREWQLALRGYKPVKRFKNESGLLSRLTSMIRRATAQQPRPTAEPRYIEQSTSRLHG
jgi:hypothetical protein